MHLVLHLSLSTDVIVNPVRCHEVGGGGVGREEHRTAAIWGSSEGEVAIGAYLQDKEVM